MIRLALPAVTAFAGAASLFAWLVGGDAPLTLAYILVGAHVFALLWILPGRVRAELAGADGGGGSGPARLPARVTIQRGERLELSLLLRSPAPWPVGVQLAWANGDRDTHAFHAAADGPADGRATRGGEWITLASGPLPRGIFRLPDIEVSRRDPLGLFAVRETVPVHAEVVVRPRVRLLGKASPLARRLAAAGGSRRGVAAPEPANWMGVRPFRPGDDRRLIHWRSSARRGTLQVLDFERVAARGLALAVDPDPFGRPDSWEAAIEAACSAARFAAHTGLPLWLWDPTLGNPGETLPWETVEEVLTRLRPRRDARFPGRLTRVARTAPNTGLVAVFSAAVSPGRWQEFARLAADAPPLAVITFDGPRLVRGGAFTHFRFADGDAFGPLAVRGGENSLGVAAR